MWLHNKSRSKRLDTEMSPVLILTHQKGCQSVSTPHLLGGPKVHRKTPRCCESLSTMFSVLTAFNIFRPKPVSQSPIGWRRTWMKDTRQDSARWFHRMPSLPVRSTPLCRSYWSYMWTVHACIKPSAQDNISSLIHTLVIHSHGFCLTL